MNDEGDDDNCQQCYEQLAPDGFPECGVNIYLECCLVVCPDTIAVGTLDNKAVMSCRNVGQLCLMV